MASGLARPPTQQHNHVTHPPKHTHTLRIRLAATGQGPPQHLQGHAPQKLSARPDPQRGQAGRWPQLDEVRPNHGGRRVLPKRVACSASSSAGYPGALPCATLGTPSDAQEMGRPQTRWAKDLSPTTTTFPPYSVGETRADAASPRPPPKSGPGALAERALIPVLPAKEGFLT